MAQPTRSLYALDPALPVLLRPTAPCRSGWSPRRAVLIQPPRGVTAAGLATLLRPCIRRYRSASCNAIPT